MDLKDELNLGFIYAGTLIGAGFASGQEIVRFFTYYGRMGFWGIAVSCFLFFLLGYFILSLSIKKQSLSVKEVILPYSGEKLEFIFEVISDIFLIGGYYIMLSGCGAVLWESIRIPYMPAVALLCIGCILWLRKGIGGLANFNKVFVTLMLLLTFIICWKGLNGFFDIKGFLKAFPTSKRGWLFSSFLYVGYNMTSACVVLCSLGTYTKRAKAALGASLLGAITLFIMALCLFFLTLANIEELSGVEVPLMYIAKKIHSNLYWVSVVVLLSAMLTTALSFGFAFAQGVSGKFGVSFDRTLLLLLIGIPFTSFGFSTLIGVIYPLFGIIGIFFGFLLFLRRFLNFKVE